MAGIVKITGTPAMANQAVEPGQDASLDRTWGGGKATRSAALTADTAVKASAGVYYGYTVTTATATNIIEIRDATSAGTGVVIDVIPTGTAAGTTKNLATGITCTTGVYADFTGTGTIIVLYL